jgi:acetyltransferase-like isoleucine patch superfamily enzyme
MVGEGWSYFFQTEVLDGSSHMEHKLNLTKENGSHTIVPEHFLNISSPLWCDPGVILGYLPGRQIDRLELKIGKGARIRSGTIIYAGSTIGDNLETGHNVLIREQSDIGENFTIWSNSVIDYGCTIGNSVVIRCNVYIPQFTVIEEEVSIAPGCSFANDFHPGCPTFRECMRGPVLKRGARIGANVTILPKVTIGDFSLVGAGSVVTKDVPAFSVVYGNPAKVLKKVTELNCKSGLRENPYPLPETLLK